MNEKIQTTMNEKIKTHLKAHRTEYVCAGSLVAGIVIGKVVFGKATIINTNNNTAIASPIVSAVSQVANGGYMHKIVKCLETGQIWETAKDAAETIGVSPSMMSKHLNGHSDHVNGLHCAIIGLGSGS